MSGSLRFALSKTFTALGIASLALSSSTWALPPSSQESVQAQVAIDPVTGDNFILDQLNIPNGKLLRINDRDTSDRDTFQLLSKPSTTAHIEIQMTQPGQLNYLIEDQGKWVVGSLVRGDSGKWEQGPTALRTSGTGRASDLLALPDGNMTLRVNSGKEKPEEILVMDQTANVVDHVPAAMMDAKLSEVAKSESQNFSASVEPADFSSGNGFGAIAGPETGTGLAYRRHFANKWGVQVGGIYFNDSTSSYGDIGVGVMRTISKTQYLRFFVLTGISTYYSSNRYTNYMPCPASVDPIKSVDPSCNAASGTSQYSNKALNFGVSIGVEAMIWDNLGAQVGIGMKHTAEINSGTRSSSTGPTGNVSLVYYIK